MWRLHHGTPPRVAHEAHVIGWTSALRGRISLIRVINIETTGTGVQPMTRSSKPNTPAHITRRPPGMSLLDLCRQTARRTFRIPSLRPEQESAMLAVLNGRDALVALPTGFGKSLIYQVPAMILDRPTIVISPLIALMADQEQALKRRGVPVIALHSRLRAAERRAALDRLENGGRLIVLTTPETLESAATATLFERARPALLCIAARRIKRLQRPGIIYCATTTAVDEVAGALTRARIPVTRYHGKMAAADREAAQRQFMIPSRRLIMVATTAFGMGIDKPNIRYILHYQAPGSLEQYVQEIGRAGRDGHPANCILLFDPADLEIHEHLQAQSRPGVRHLEKLEAALTAWTDEQRAPTSDTLAVSAGVPVRICEVLLSDLEEAGLIERAADGGIAVAVTQDKFAAGVHELVAKLKTFRFEGERRLRLIADYALSNECRSVFIRRYFGEDHPPRCGTCDRCRADSSIATTPGNSTPRARHHRPAQASPRMHTPLRERATPAALGPIRGEGPATAGSENARPRKRTRRSRTRKAASK